MIGQKESLKGLHITEDESLNILFTQLGIGQGCPYCFTDHLWQINIVPSTSVMGLSNSYYCYSTSHIYLPLHVS